MPGFGFNPYSILAAAGGSALGAGFGQLFGGKEGAKEGFYKGGGDTFIGLGDFINHEDAADIESPFDLFNLFDLSGNKGQGPGGSTKGHTPPTGDGLSSLFSFFGPTPSGGGTFGEGFTSGPSDWNNLGITPSGSSASTASSAPVPGPGGPLSGSAINPLNLLSGSGGQGPSAEEQQRILEEQRKAEEALRLIQVLQQNRARPGPAPIPGPTLA